MGPRQRLEPPDLNVLLKAVDDVTNPLVTVCTRLWEPAEAMPHTASFTVGATVAALLQDNLLPLPEQRLVAIYILYDLIVSRFVLHRSLLVVTRLGAQSLYLPGAYESVAINADKIPSFLLQVLY
jgi:hypothetical protein